MKIALVVHDFDPGYGQGRYTVELARRLASEHEVRVLANTFGGPLQPRLAYQKAPAWRRAALTTVPSFIAAAEWRLRDGDFDLIHAQGVTCWRADVITSHICHAASQANTPVTNLRRRLFPWLATRLEHRFYRQRRAAHLIAVSRRCAEEIRRHYAWQRDTTVIYHGTDTEQFHPPTPAERAAARTRYGIPAERWTWLFMGEAGKGLDHVLAQLPAFPAAGLLVVTRSVLAPFQARARALGVADRVVFWGPETDPVHAYQAADLFVYPSPYDTFGMVVTEAMATGLPVIASRDIGAAELIRESHNGLLCQPATPATLRAALHWVADHRDEARALGQAARATVQQYSWDACATATLGVYEQVLRGRRAR